MKKKKWIALWLSLLLITSLPVSCKQQDSGGDYTLVNVNAIESSRSILLMPFYLALELKFFEEEGLDITLHTAGSKNQAFSNLFSQEASFYIGGPENAFYHLQKEKAEKIIFLAQASTGSGAYLITRKGDQPFSWQQLKGTSIIGANIGELEQVIFEHLLKKNKLKPFLDVHIIQNLPYQLIPGTFRAGTGQYLLATEPVTSRVEMENDAYAVHVVDLSGKPLMTNAVITTMAYFNESNDICRKFINALGEGLIWINEHTPEEIVELGKKYFPSENEKILIRAVSRYKTLGLWPLATVVDPHDLAVLQEVLTESKMLNSPIPLDSLIFHQ